jgi:hypothetical protein
MYIFLVRVMVYSQQIAPSYQVLLVLYHGGQFYWRKQSLLFIGLL